MKRMFFNIVLPTVLLAGTSTVRAEDKTATAAPPSASISTAANDKELFEATEKNLAIVHFPTGKANLSQTDKDKLLDTVNNAKKLGKIDEIIVAAWSDKAYPSAKGEKLARSDKKLASQRARNIKTFLKEKEAGIDVKTYSMAEHPGWLSRIFKTDEAFLKQALPESKATTRDDLALEYYGKMLGEKAGPSTAAVIVRGARELMSH